MKRTKWIWLVVVLLVAGLSGTFVWQKHQLNKNDQKQETVSSVRSTTSNGLLALTSGQSDTVKGLKINVLSLKKTDYKAFHSRSVVKIKLQLKNTTKSNLYVVASAPNGAFDTGFKNIDSRNMTGLATDDITATAWTSSVKYFENGAGQLKDDQLISNNLQKKGDVILGQSGKYRYLCWKLAPGQTVSGNAYGLYTEDNDHPKELPVLKVNTEQIGVLKEQIDQYQSTYEEQAGNSQSWGLRKAWLTPKDFVH